MVRLTGGGTASEAGPGHRHRLRSVRARTTGTRTEPGSLPAGTTGSSTARTTRSSSTSRPCRCGRARTYRRSRAAWTLPRPRSRAARPSRSRHPIRCLRSRTIKDLELLPVALSAFLALLAVSAVGHALATAVRRRRHDLAVLRALGITRRQARLVVTTQASLLALIGLVFGVPLGIALGRAVWRTVAGFTPLAYHPPLALLALLLIGPGRPAGRERAGRLAPAPRRTAALRACSAQRMTARTASLP